MSSYGRTVRVRIPVVTGVSHDNSAVWFAIAVSSESSVRPDDAIDYLRSTLPLGSEVHWIEAEVPVPNGTIPSVVKGVVA